MKLQRKLTLMVATGAVALGAGHFVQQRAEGRGEGRIVVSSLTPVAAGPEEIGAGRVVAQPPVLPAEAASLPVPEAPPEVAAAPAPTPPAPAAVAALAEPEAVNCEIQLDLLPQPDAMIGLALLAPCHAGERVVLLHAGLAVTQTTSPSGALFTILPALTAVADVKVAFGSGDSASGRLPMPDFTNIRRFAVQWQDEDAFQLHAFENGAGYDQPGHISAAYTGNPGETGYLTVLGDASTELPLLAEVYTFGPDRTAEVVLEAAITDTTCAREILGETILADKGSVEISDLTLAMPECDAAGDILVLKNLVQDMTLAAVN